ncbi:hypothetical protein A6C57_25905 [Fibrella sp. ES10-3-2-2]
MITLAQHEQSVIWRGLKIATLSSLGLKLGVGPLYVKPAGCELANQPYSRRYLIHPGR